MASHGRQAADQPSRKLLHDVFSLCICVSVSVLIVQSVTFLPDGGGPVLILDDTGSLPTGRTKRMQ